MSVLRRSPLAAVAAVAVFLSVALSAAPAQGARASRPQLVAEDTAVFAGGCFWGVEAVFEHVKGVKSATSGYAGGTVAAPSYDAVSSGETGHAESVRVVYDPAQVSYAQLLHVFFAVAHDPTELNRQGPDRGTQYRSAIFYRTAEQRRAAEAYVDQLTKARVFPRPIVTQIAPLGAFHEAEAYHQNYLEQHPNQPYIVINDAPKLVQLRRQFAAIYRDGTAGDGR
jgi:peptide-methionine (S)-S-oxide reductase